VIDELRNLATGVDLSSTELKRADDRVRAAAQSFRESDRTDRRQRGGNRRYTVDPSSSSIRQRHIGDFEAAIERGEVTLDQLFDENYREIPRYRSEAVSHQLVAFTDRVLPPIQDPDAENRPANRVLCCPGRRAVICRRTIRTIAGRRARILSGIMPIAATSGCSAIVRCKRCAANTKPFLLQTYRREMGGGQVCADEGSFVADTRSRSPLGRVPHGLSPVLNARTSGPSSVALPIGGEGPGMIVKFSPDWRCFLYCYRVFRKATRRLGGTCSNNKNSIGGKSMKYLIVANLATVMPGLRRFGQHGFHRPRRHYQPEGRPERHQRGASQQQPSEPAWPRRSWIPRPGSFSYTNHVLGSDRAGSRRPLSRPRRSGKECGHRAAVQDCAKPIEGTATLTENQAADLLAGKCMPTSIPRRTPAGSFAADDEIETQAPGLDRGIALTSRRTRELDGAYACPGEVAIRFADKDMRQLWNLWRFPSYGITG